MRLPQNSHMRRILLAQLPADFADWLDYVAIISLFTYTWQVDPVYFAWFIVCLTGPYVVIGPLAGALVDRFDLKGVMVGANFGRALTTFALAFAGLPELMLVLVALRGAVDSFFSPAKQVAIQTLATRDELMATNSASHVINQTSKVAGPAVGGALLLLISPQMVFVVNGVVSLLAMAILLGLPANLKPKTDTSTDVGDKSTSMFSEIAKGFAVVLEKPALWVTIGLAAMGFFAIFLYDTLLGPLTRELGFDQTILGMSIAAVGGGGVLGALLLGSVKRQIHPYLLMGPSMIIVSGFTILLGWLAINGWVIPSYVFIAAFFTVGVINVGTFVPIRIVLQLETPPDKMGRVTAVNEMTSIVAMMSAPFIGASLAALYELGVPFIVGGSLTLILGILTLILIKFVHFSAAGDLADLSKAPESG
ncbi:MFS transporter [Maritalea mediterranea]|uniref:MFS transporter n=1 Tax=Maritalea mediterranea TaxID=2909667 RepID=A0ABS9E8B7_9HYPH|nr:MFS transporter [Maritalea mediterranea]MCF4099116.1 MFS transporter [Maritalea mediterranea]